MAVVAPESYRVSWGYVRLEMGEKGEHRSLMLRSIDRLNVGGAETPQGGDSYPKTKQRRRRGQEV